MKTEKEPDKETSLEAALAEPALRAIIESEARLLAELILVSRLQSADPKILKIDMEKVFSYVTDFCGGGNNCTLDLEGSPSGEYPMDCTHFMSHALNKGGVFVKNPEASCPSALCIRAAELGASFYNSTTKFTNVKQVALKDAKRGDFCFIPKWFGLSKLHVMLMDSPTRESQGKIFASVYGHTNHRCAQDAEIDPDSTFYRIG